MTLPLGLNFRATSGFVTDGTNEFPELATSLYPHTTNGVSVGWVSGMDNSSTRDRSSSIDRRIAGLHFTGNTAGGSAKRDFKITLPSAGDYQIWIGAGDNSGQAIITLELFDNTTSLGLILSAADTTGAAKFFDATGTLRASAAAWASAYSASSITKTFATTTMILRLGGTGDVSNSMLNHVFVQSATSNVKQRGLACGFVGMRAGSRSMVMNREIVDLVGRPLRAVRDLVDRFGRPLAPAAA